MLKHIWNDYISPLLRRPPRFQVAALCFRRATEGPEVLLVTSLATQRWILPKGWPKTGLSAGGTALEEAWEEAGVKPAEGKPVKVGQYGYPKRLRGGVPVATEVHVFAVEVAETVTDFPEADRRTLRWMSPEEAAEAVDEPELSELLSRFPEELAAQPTA